MVQQARKGDVLPVPIGLFHASVSTVLYATCRLTIFACDVLFEICELRFELGDILRKNWMLRIFFMALQLGYGIWFPNGHNSSTF